MNITEITQALQQQINDYQAVRAFMNLKEVQRDAPINEDEDNIPWVCVYKGAVDYAPNTLGSHGYLQADLTLRVLVQAISWESGDECSTLLDGYVKTIVSAIRSDMTIKGKVDIITSLSVDFSYTETDRTSLYFQMASITINATLDDSP